jgi:hypothetical protein
MAAGAVNTMMLKDLGARGTELIVKTDVNILGKIGNLVSPYP